MKFPTQTHSRRRSSSRALRALLVLALGVASTTACRSRESNGASATQSASMLPAAIPGSHAGGPATPGVTVRAFCDGIGNVFCSHCAPGASDCVTRFMGGCLEDHDPNASTAHSQSDLDACAREIAAGNCDQMSSGALPAACQ